MQDLLSLGKMAELTQEPPRLLQRTLDALGIEPALVLNDVAYYPREACGKAMLTIMEHRPLPVIEGRDDA